MKKIVVQWTASLAVTCGLLTFQVPVMSAPPTVSKAAVKDISLTSGGTLTGKVVDANGFGIDGAMVAVHLANNVVAKTVTDKAGSFTITNLRGGTYQITAGQTTGLYRLWAENTAPPQTLDRMLMVSEPGVVRGQVGPLVNSSTVLQLTTLGLAGVGAGFGIASYQEAEDANETSERVLRTVQQQQASPN